LTGEEGLGLTQSGSERSTSHALKKNKKMTQALPDRPDSPITASLNGEAFEQLGITASPTQTSEEAAEINTTA
jgi:hypothetical protein